jgi:hypothetical protein
MLGTPGEFLPLRLQPSSTAGGSSVILPLQKHPYQENQGTNNPEEGLGILGPLPVLHFAFAFKPQLYKPTVRN